MRRIAWGMVVFLALAACAWPARAQTSVRIVETWPPGQDVVLGRNQHFYLRIAYDTREPVQIWARPMYRGKPAKAGSNPSQTYTGNGEALAWFFLMEPGARVDEVRIRVGDGSPDNTRVLATWRGEVSGGGMASIAPEPGWAVRMRSEAKAAQDSAARQAANQPLPPWIGLIAYGFAMAVLGAGVLGFAAPVWAARRWSGGWRVAALAPLVYMGFVVLRIFFGVLIDPTSHNLWPFELLMAGGLGFLVVGGLWLVRKLAGIPEAGAIRRGSG